MLKSSCFILMLVGCVGGYAQNVPLLSPLKKETKFYYSKTDSSKLDMGFMSLEVLTSRNGKAQIQHTETSKNDTLSYVFSYHIDSTGFSLSPYFFLSAKEVIGFQTLQLREPKEKLVYPSTFEADTLEDVFLDLKFKYEGQKLADFHVSFTNRTIENGEFLFTPFGRKYCYKATTIKKEAILFREKIFKYVDWYCSQGLVKREVFLNERLVCSYVLKSVR